MAKSEDRVNDEPTMAQVLDRMAQILAANSEMAAKANNVQREQLKQTQRKSNASAPLASVFNPRGQKDFPMPPLKCEVWMPFPQRPDLHGLDREEVELMNLLIDDVLNKIQSKEAPIYSVELNDDSTVLLCIEPVYNRTTQQLERIRWCGPTDPDTRMPTPFFTSENRQQFRTLKMILRGILPEDKVAAVMPMRQEFKQVQEFQKLDAIDRTNRDKYTEAYDARPTAAHKGPLACSIGE